MTTDTKKNSGTFTKKDFVDMVHNIIQNSDFKWKDSCTKNQSEKIYDHFVESLIVAIKENPDGIKLGRLGTFKIRKKAERQGKNPRTGEPIKIPSRKDLSFKVSSNVKDEINQ
jgi:DNA-binding protein HU-beta